MNRGVAKRITLSLVFATIVSFLILTSSTISANVIVDDISVTVPASCTLSSGATIDALHNANINNGTYKENIGITTFKIFCNDNNGFSVYAIGYSDEEFGNTDMIATVNEVLSPSYNIPTGLAISGNTSNWAMKLIPVEGTHKPTILSDTNGSFADYHVVPTDYAKVATLASNTDFTNGSSFQTTYRAYIGPKQPAGNYEGKVRYVIVHPNDAVAPLYPVTTAAGKIGYVPNASGVVDTMGDQTEPDAYNPPLPPGVNPTTLISPNDSVRLWASNFRRDGYGFVGWSDKFDWKLGENDANGNGTGPNAGYHIYGPNQIITAPADIDVKGLTLYAVWVKSAGNLQNWDQDACIYLDAGQIIALTDTRDNNVYAVAKLADGNCWMIENLRLGGDSPITFTIGSWASGYYTESDFTLLASQDPRQTAWCTDDDNTCFDQSMLYSGNTTNSVAYMTNSNSNVYSYGNYYNFYLARQICPTGWRAPIGGTDGDFDQLAKKNNNILHTYPNNFLNSGSILGSSIGGRGWGSMEHSLYWSGSTPHITYAYNAYGLEFDSDIGLSIVSSAANHRKYYGGTIRCILNQGVILPSTGD